MEKLEQLKRAREELSEKRKTLLTLNKAWKTYKYRYRNEPWYMELAYLSGLGIRDASKYENILGDTYEDFIVSQPNLAGLAPQKVGLRLAEQISILPRDIRDLQYRIKDLLMDAWEQEHPLKTISKYYGASENTTYVAITRCPRFQQDKRRRHHKE